MVIITFQHVNRTFNIIFDSFKSHGLTNMMKLSMKLRIITQDKADANFARFTAHALLSVFPEESWVLERIWIRVAYMLTGRFNLNIDTCST